MNNNKLVGYALLSCLHSKPYKHVYRAQKQSSAETVILKVVDKRHRHLEVISQLKNEYELLNTLYDVDGVPDVIELIEDDEHLVLVLSDFGGSSLDHVIYDQNMSLETKIDLLVQCTEILEHLHSRHIIHKDIKPANIIWNESLKKVQIVDFGLSVPFNQRLNQFYHPPSIQGSLCYSSPEQTGRVNRNVDFRSDYYSLGATAYELFALQKPFSSSLNTDELLYQILAVEPVSLHELSNKVPTAISELIARLLSKDADDRYQTSYGLRYDLQHCLDGEFDALGMHDVLSSFKTPSRVYGRDQELSILFESFSQAVRGNSQHVLLSGYSGVGKTSLARELCGHVKKHQGYFVEGKFDQLHRNHPLVALTDAFNDFFGLLLVGPSQVVSDWHDRMLSCLGSNAGVMTGLLPNLEHLLGVQPEPIYLGGEEGLNRLVYSFLEMIREVASAHKPLVIFIDDIQWIDLASLMLLEAIVRSEDLHHVMLIGAYRSNEVPEGHPISDFLKKSDAEGLPVTSLPLKNLSFAPVELLLSEGFQNRIHDTHRLAQFIWEKTAGNPYFVIELVNRLIAEKIIAFDGEWKCDFKRLANLSVSDNVVGLMLDRITHFENGESRTLCIAALLGYEFSAESLTIVSGSDLNQVISHLVSLVRSGVLIASENTFRFAHDGVQKAALSLLPENDLEQLHYDIASHLLARQNDEKFIDEHLFDICFHLNRSAALVEANGQTHLRVEFNARAANAARKSAAYQSAFEFIQTAIDSDTQKSDTSRSSFSLLNEAAECAYLCGHSALTLSYCDQAEEKATSSLEHVMSKKVRVLQLVAMGEYAAAMQEGIEALSHYDIDLPALDVDAEIERAFIHKKALFESNWIHQGKSIDDLFDLPISHSQEISLLMELLGELYASALMCYPNYLRVVTMELVNLSISHGNTAISPIAYAWHGSAITSIINRYEDAYAFGRLAIRLNEEKINNPAISCKIYNMVGNFINFFKEPLRATLPMLRQAYNLGMSSGDKLYGSYSIINELRNTLSSGMPLYDWLLLDDEVKLKLERCDAQVMIDVRESFRAYAMQLSGLSDTSDSLNNHGFSEVEYRDKYAEVTLFHNLLDAWKIQSSYHLGLYENALAISEADSSSISSFVLGVEIRFFSALTWAYYLRTDPANSNASSWRTSFIDTCEWLKSLADICPENFSHLSDILSAELHWIDGQRAEAIRCFNHAIAAAKSQLYLQYQALAHELLCSLCFENNMPETGYSHLKLAYSSYKSWGAVAKLKLLEDQYPSIGLNASATNLNEESSSSYIGKADIANRLDLKSIMSSSLALSSERDIDLLIDGLMQDVAEGSGAQKAVLLLPSEGTWEVVAFRGQCAEQDKGQVPESVLAKALRTQQAIHIGDASEDHLFSSDPYIIQFNVKSIICLPLVHVGNIRAVLYLENRLAKHFFSAEQIQRLTLLSSQMASAIENSLNYQRLSDSELHYRSLLSNLPIGIVVYDSKNSISYANTHASRMLDLKLNKSGHQKSYSLVGRLIEDRSDNTGADADPVSRVFETGRALTGVVYRYQFAGDSEARWYLLSAFPQYVNDEIENVITSVIDVTERRVNEAKIEQLAFNDVLTGLPNRPSFEKALVESIGLVQREKLYSALILFDIDNFNVINDSLGHRIGDRLLQLMASRLTDALEEGAMLSRLGGDEFAILLSSEDLNESVLREKVNVLANTLQQAFSKVFVVEGHQLNINISIGIALIPFDGLTVDMLLRRADAALYQSKKAGRNTMSFFEMEQENEIQRRLQLENEMREGLKTEQFCLEYQPKVDIETGDIVGAEALVRWKHPTHGVISPEEFIPVAEDSGLILSLGEWVINEALSQTGRWQKEMPGFEKFERISVNVSPVQFNDAEFEDVVKRAIQSSGTVPEKLDIEITEGLLLDNTDRVVEKLGRFKELGVSFSIDDFGTGYSSLAYLKRLPVDVVKIDQSFVREMNSDEGDKAIVLAILAIAKSLGLTTVAEGVEEAEHLHSLKEMGCHVYQGYYYSKPLSPERFERLMHSSDVSLH